jgi:hypothetical protein
MIALTSQKMFTAQVLRRLCQSPALLVKIRVTYPRKSNVPFLVEELLHASIQPQRQAENCSARAYAQPPDLPCQTEWA